MKLSLQRLPTSAASLIMTRTSFVKGAALSDESHHRVPLHLDVAPVPHLLCVWRRRLECHNCSTPRPANPRRVAAEMDSPSNILKLSNLDPMVTCDAAASAPAPDKALTAGITCCPYRR